MARCLIKLQTTDTMIVLSALEKKICIIILISYNSLGKCDIILKFVHSTTFICNGEACHLAIYMCILVPFLLTQMSISSFYGLDFLI